MGSQTSGRPGGNPEFGKTIKRDAAGSEPLEKLLNIRLTPSMDKWLRSLGDRRLDFVREAIAEKMEREATPTATKTERTAPETETGQQLERNLTTQEGQELETSPTLAEQVADPKTRRKANQTQEQKQAKPTTEPK
jgi:hypothetical protein